MQTILAAVLRRRHPERFAPERLELADGDFLDLEWLRSGHRRLAIISHGLEGSSRATYVRGTAAALHAAGWDALVWNFRGCSSELNRLVRFYHSGESADLRTIVAHAAERYDHIDLVGFSLGGNITLKYLGETPSHPAVRAAVAVSAPVDLTSSARALDQLPSNRLYLHRFLTSLIAKVEAKASRFPAELDTAGIRRIRSFAEFDGRYTAPLHGFLSAEDYWTRASSRPHLSRITVPALLLSALDDPFLPPECFPEPEAEASAHFHLEAPAHGGHVGFLDFRNGIQPWSERRILEFLSEHSA